MISNSLSVSRAVSDVVGSSKIMSRACRLSALAISTSWRSPWGRPLTGVIGETCKSTSSSAFFARSLRLRRSMIRGQSPNSSGKMVEEDVLLDAEIWKEAELLVDEGDPERERVARAGRRDLLPAKLHPAAILRQHAAQNVHRRRLAGAVLTDQTENGAVARLEADVAEDLDAEEALVEPAGPQEDVGHRLAPCPEIVPDSVCHGREQDDAALDRVDRRERQAEQLQAVIDHAEKQHARQHAEHRSLAPE